MISDKSLKVLYWTTRIGELFILVPWIWNHQTRLYDLRKGKHLQIWKYSALFHIFGRICLISYLCLGLSGLYHNPLTLIEIVIGVFIVSIATISLVFQTVNFIAYKFINENVNGLLIFNRRLGKSYLERINLIFGQ